MNVGRRRSVSFAFWPQLWTQYSAVALHRTAAIKSISESMGKKVKVAPEPETPAQDAAAAVKKSKKAKSSTEEGTDLAVDCPVIRCLNDSLNMR